MRSEWQNGRRNGAMMVLIAFCLPLCLIMAAFAVNVAWMQLVRTELRTGTDAAARAGAEGLSLYQNTTTAQAKAIEAAARNRVAGQPLKITGSNIEFGNARQATEAVRFLFTSGGSSPNAVRVTVGGDKNSGTSEVGLLFSGVFKTRSFRPRETATATVLDRDICLVVDRSGSMMWTLFDSTYPPGRGPCTPPHPVHSRWGALTVAVDAFLKELKNTLQDEHVALVSYSSNYSSCGYTYKISTIDCQLSADYRPVSDAIASMSSKPVSGATSISAGIDSGIEVLTGAGVRPFATKTMIVLTDGIHNTGPEPVLSAQVAAQKGIVIHTITFSSDADIKRMEAVAAATGGRHFHADDKKELVDVFRELAGVPVLLTD